MIAVVIPSYRVRSKILEVLRNIGPEVTTIIVVDDCCPEQSGRYVEEKCQDPRVTVVYNKENLGVGGAVIAGYREAIQSGATVIVKVDGDGQMNPAFIPVFARPILEGRADYTKGNRFYQLESLCSMPPIRLFGNALLSFCSKLSSGYWQLMDPTNGYTAIHASIAKLLPFDKISERYFFESDMLFRLGTIRARIVDVPMHANYGDEESNLSVLHSALRFPLLHLSRFFKRIFYAYFLRDFTVASLELVFGLGLMSFGIIFGLYHWWQGVRLGISTPVGTVMLAAINVILGFQLLLSWLTYDINSQPRDPLHGVLTTDALGLAAPSEALRLTKIPRKVGRA